MNDNPYQPSDARPQPELNREELANIVIQLESLAAGLPGYARLTHGEAGPGPTLLADRSALVRIAAACTALAASDPSEPNSTTSIDELSVHQLVLGPLDSKMTAIKHVIDFPSPFDVSLAQKRKMTFRDRLGLIGCAIISCIALFMVFTGAAFWCGHFLARFK